jgi:hypothetical protein
MDAKGLCYDNKTGPNLTMDSQRGSLILLAREKN